MVLWLAPMFFALSGTALAIIYAFRGPCRTVLPNAPIFRAFGKLILPNAPMVRAGN